MLENAACCFEVIFLLFNLNNKMDINNLKSKGNYLKGNQHHYFSFGLAKFYSAESK